MQHVVALTADYLIGFSDAEGPLPLMFWLNADVETSNVIFCNSGREQLRWWQVHKEVIPAASAAGCSCQIVARSVQGLLEPGQLHLLKGGIF